MFKIQIPKPCHEDWSAMTPTQQGAFCSSCSKEVIDFTKMTDEEIQNYFLHKSAGKTCGRFKTEQVHRIRITLPKNILLQKIAGWKKFMAVMMLAFGSMLFGCDVGTPTTLGKVQKANPTLDLKSQNLYSDTLQLLSEIAPTMGTPSVIKPDTISCSGDIIGALVDPPQQHVIEVLKGDISITPDTVSEIKTDSIDYNNVFTGKILPEKRNDTATKKPASDISKCKDTGFF